MFSAFSAFSAHNPSQISVIPKPGLLQTLHSAPTPMIAIHQGFGGGRYRQELAQLAPAESHDPDPGSAHSASAGPLSRSGHHAGRNRATSGRLHEPSDWTPRRQASRPSPDLVLIQVSQLLFTPRLLTTEASARFSESMVHYHGFTCIRG
jgi:hypothetical protein